MTEVGWPKEMDKYDDDEKDEAMGEKKELESKNSAIMVHKTAKRGKEKCVPRDNRKTHSRTRTRASARIYQNALSLTHTYIDISSFLMIKSIEKHHFHLCTFRTMCSSVT